MPDVPPTDLTRLCDELERLARKVDRGPSRKCADHALLLGVEAGDLLALVRAARAAAVLREAAGPFVEAAKYCSISDDPKQQEWLDTNTVLPAGLTCGHLRALARAAAPEGPRDAAE